MRRHSVEKRREFRRRKKLFSAEDVAKFLRVGLPTVIRSKERLGIPLGLMGQMNAQRVIADIRARQGARILRKQEKEELERLCD